MMNDTTILRVQNLLLSWLSDQKNPVSHEKIRSICDICAFSVTRQKQSYPLYRYFYPLVRAGFIEGGLEKNKMFWQLSKPMVFFRDNDCERNWIGINLPETFKDNISKKYNLIEDESNLDFEQHKNVVRWTTGTDYDGAGLPIINNPPTINLLHSLPVCSPELFAQKAYFNINVCTHRYCPQSKSKKWEIVQFQSIIPNGLYRVSDQIHSPRIYFNSGITYSLQSGVDNEYWAKFMHCVNNNIPLFSYSAEDKYIKFYHDPPIILSRILFINQMFDHFQVNPDPYYKYRINDNQLKEVNRIFSTKITKGDQQNA